MFDVSFTELMLIAVVALLVLGPERLPKAARFAGLWMRKARTQWYSVKSEFERELAAEELKRSLQEQAAQVKSEFNAARDELRGAADAARGALAEAESADAERKAASDAAVTPRDPPAP